ncbi:hypothetical protein Y032_0002g1112 [Ancylostoma ceylanicum]|uniref:Secreted protein n=1 Tax=Ancylostoma ceylanicum TaxID=53326 RepID=A0A016W1C6_9BILA|nr:hypothetical protein Y032_0002g1112 [Ancylostoma ceylanicum]
MSSIDLYVMLSLVGLCLARSPSLTRDGHVKSFSPPPIQHLIQDRHCVSGGHYTNNSQFNCHGAKFVSSNGYFQPCNRHSHCYHAREPTDWCVLAPHHRYTNWGCHCDRKLGSCVIERYDYKQRQLQWAYCTPNNEFYCATRFHAFFGQ